MAEAISREIIDIKERVIPDPAKINFCDSKPEMAKLEQTGFRLILAFGSDRTNLKFLPKFYSQRKTDEELLLRHPNAMAVVTYSDSTEEDHVTYKQVKGIKVIPVSKIPKYNPYFTRDTGNAKMAIVIPQFDRPFTLPYIFLLAEQDLVIDEQGSQVYPKI